MKRLVFLVEGDTEILFINKLIIPYLYEMGFTNSMNAQAVITNRKQHKKGGITNYVLLKNDLERILSQPNVIVTTFIDLLCSRNKCNTMRRLNILHSHLNNQIF